MTQSDVTNRWPKQNGLRNHQHRKKKTINLCHTSEKQGNRLTRRPATVVNFFQPFWSWKMFKTLCFSHFSSLGGIFQASSLCTAWANSKFRQYVFVKAKYVQSKSCGSAASLYKHIDYPYLYPYLSDYLSIYPNILMYPCCARYVQGMQKETKEEHVES